MEQILHCFVSSHQTDWDLLLPCAEFALNSTPSVSTGFSPAYVLFGCVPNLPLETAVRALTDVPMALVVDYISRMSEVVNTVRTTLGKAVQAMEQ